MKYEFILKEKLVPSDSFSQIGRIVVEECYFDEQYKRYQDYINKREKRYPLSDHVLLVNLLDDAGEFVEVVQ